MYLYLIVLVLVVLFVIYLFGLNSVKEFCSEIITDERLRQDVKECAVDWTRKCVQSTTVENTITPESLVKAIVPKIW